MEATCKRVALVRVAKTVRMPFNRVRELVLYHPNIKVKQRAS